MNSSEWLSIVEYARTYALSDMTVRRRIKTGRLHAELRDGKYYIPASVKPNSGFNDEDVLGIRPIPKAQPIIKSHPNPTLTHVNQSSLASHNFERLPASPEKKSPVSNALSDNFGRTVHGTQSAANEFANTDDSAASVSDFAHRLINKFSQVEKAIEEKYQNRMEKLAEELKNRDLIIHSLKQNVEDLQTLVKVLEARR